MELYKEYTLKNGDVIIFDGIAMYEDYKRVPLDMYTSKMYNGTWNKKGRFLTNIYFLDGAPSEMDVVLK